MPDTPQYKNRLPDPNLLELNRALGETIGHVKSFNGKMIELREDMDSLRSVLGGQCENCGPAKDLKTQKKVGYALFVAFLITIIKDFKPIALLKAVKSMF